MIESTDTRSLKALFSFPFQGRDWPGRFLVGSLLIAAGYIIPIIPLIFVLGYVLQVLRQAVEGQEPALPAWDNWGKLGGDGLRLFAVTLIYTLPGAIVFIGGVLIYFLGIFGLSASGNSDAAGLLFLFVLGFFLLALFVGMALLILGLIPLPMAAANLAAQGRVGAGFQVGELNRLIGANKLGYLVAWVVTLGLYALWSLGATLIYYTMCLCGLLPLLAAPVAFYLGLVGAALFGRTYRESRALLAARTVTPQTNEA